MIADLDKTIKELVVEEMPIKNGEVDVKFDQPTREWSSRLTKPTVNFFLYDVRENNVLRQHQWERLDGNGNGRDRQARMKRTPHRVDCNYMITTWAAKPEDEHRLLTRCLLALFRHPTLPEDRLLGSLQNPQYEIRTHLASHDKLTNPAEVWSALDNELRPSVSYVITLALDPWTEVSGPMVLSRTLRTGQSETLPQEQALLEETAVEANVIGGVVAKGDEPQSDITVAVKGSGLSGTTDGQGRFTLGALPPGDYTLMAWPPEGKPTEKDVSVPAGDYDIEL